MDRDNLNNNKYQFKTSTSFKWIIPYSDLIDAMENGTTYNSKTFSSTFYESISWKMNLKFNYLFKVHIEFEQIDFLVSRVQALYELCLMNGHDEKSAYRKKFDTTFCDLDNISSATTFFSLKELRSNGLIVDEELTIFCEIQLSYDVVKTSFNRDFKNIYDKNILSDCTININGSCQSRNVHKFILAAKSPVFLSMFQTDMLEKNSSTVCLNDIDVETLDQILHFMYTGSPDELDGIAHKVLLAAEKYLIYDLKNICQAYIINHLEDYHIIDIFAFAVKHRASELKNEAIKRLKHELSRSEIRKEVEFLDINLKKQILFEIDEKP